MSRARHGLGGFAPTADLSVSGEVVGRLLAERLELVTGVGELSFRTPGTLISDELAGLREQCAHRDQHDANHERFQRQ